jgi:hypothetical protein
LRRNSNRRRRRSRQQQINGAWLDFITWYHQAIIDFAEESIKITLKYFPREKVRTKPGGNAGGGESDCVGNVLSGLCEDGAALQNRPSTRRLSGRDLRATNGSAPRISFITCR